MQADARLVEDVHHVDQAAAEVLDHLDALRLAARERVGLAVQAQVVEADVDERSQPLEQRSPPSAPTAGSLDVRERTSIRSSISIAAQLGDVAAR